MPKGYQQSWQEPEDAHTKHISTTQPVFPVLPNPWMMKEVLLCEEKCDFWMVEEFIAEITYRFKKKKVLSVPAFEHFKKSAKSHPQD